MDSHGLTLDALVGGLCFRRDDNVWAAEGEGRSRFPEGMTERNANAKAKAKAKAEAEAEAKAKAKAKAGFGLGGRACEPTHHAKGAR